MENDAPTNLYRSLGISFLYLLSGAMLIGGNIWPPLGMFFYTGILLVSFLIMKGYITRAGIYCFLASYFLLLGFGVWNYIFPYYTGILLSILLGELFGRLLYNALMKWREIHFRFWVIAAFFFLFDFGFQNIPVLRSVQMIPLLSPIATHYVTIRGASIVGGHLILAAIILILSSLVKIIANPKDMKTPLMALILCGFLVISPHIFDLIVSKGGGNDEKVRIAVIQGSYKLPGDRGMQYEDYIENKLVYYMGLASKRNADIIIFPETVLGIYDTSNKVDGMFRESLIDASKRLGEVSVFVVTEGNSDTNAKEERFVSALLMEDGGIKGISRKRNLVPFKETKTYSKGKEYDVYETKFGRLGISICYDINGDSVKKLKKNGADMILAPFNDGGFGGIYHNIHRYYPIIRAVEYGVPIAVANEDGISQIVDGKGRICGELGYGSVGRLDYLITPKTGNSPYLLFGKYFEWFIFWGLTLLIFLSCLGVIDTSIHINKQDS